MTAPKRTADDDEKNAPRVRRKIGATLDFSSEPRRILVGEDEEAKPFYVQEHLLIKHSSLFSKLIGAEKVPVATAEKGKKVITHNKICSPSTSAKGTLELEDDYPEPFAMFCSFLHNGYVCSVTEISLHDDRPDHTEWQRLTSAWRLGQRMDSTSLKDAIADAIVGKLSDDSDIWPGWVFAKVVSWSSEESPIRQLCADIIAYRWDDDNVKEDFQKLDDVDFLRTLATTLWYARMVTSKNAERWFDKCGCRYHEHVANGEPCYKEMF